MKLFIKTWLRGYRWRKVRALHLQYNNTCASCGGTKKLEVHHLKPVHKFPELAYELDNLLTLCESKKYGINCHLHVGHNGNYKKINPFAKNTAKKILTRLRVRD